MDTHIHRWQTFLSIMVQHIQSPHARDEIKLIKYATYFRDGHAPAPNYTSHTEGQRVEEVEVATAVADMAVAVAARLAVAMIILAVVTTVATVATTAAKAEVEEATARSHGAWAPLH